MIQSKSYSFISRLVVLFFVIVLTAWMGWIWWKDSISEVDPNSKTPVTFVVKSGDGVKAIAQNLAIERLIRSPTGFYLLIKILGIETKLQAGEFRLNQAMDAKTIALELTHGISDIWLTIPEGLRSEEIASKISRELDIPEAEFLKHIKEGYMFPDTYLIPRDATAAAVALMLQKNFDKKFTTQMKRDAGKTGLSLEQIIILASIVEREGSSASDRPVIAGILLKRIDADWPLQVDASLQYALGYQAYEKTWWKKSLTNDDKKIKSLFNTYEHTGLPPGPISNPGIESIRAVIYPERSEYWYYLHDPAGGIHYGRTIEEHEANIAKFLQ